MVEMRDTIEALIVDDERPAREEMVWLLEQCEGVRVLGQADSAQAALQALQASVDLVLLDVDMPGIDGVRLAERWSATGQGPLVIFVTAHEEHAVDAFNVEAVDYLLKPVRLERLQRALQRARQRLGQRRHQQGEEARQRREGEEDGATTSGRPLQRISVQEQGGVYRVLPVDEILFFESDGGIVVVESTQGRHITDFSLKFLEQNLDQERFFRCHRSTIVQLDAIEAIVPWGAGTYRLILDRERDLGVPLARSRAGELKSLIPWSATAFED